jgi:Uma2 family endonuclease
MPMMVQTPERRVLLNGVTWETYSRLVEECQESSGTRLTYDRGALEIMTPSFQHESFKEVLARLFESLADVRGMDYFPGGSTTFRREDLEQGFEPDACFYVRNAKNVRGRTEIDLKTDPPPDLVIEVDITGSSLNKQEVFSAVGIFEIWRYAENRVEILRLESGSYSRISESALLPGITSSQLTAFLQASQTMTRVEWIRFIRGTSSDGG